MNNLSSGITSEIEDRSPREGRFIHPADGIPAGGNSAHAKANIQKNRKPKHHRDHSSSSVASITVSVAKCEESWERLAATRHARMSSNSGNMAYFLDARPHSLLLLNKDCRFGKRTDIYTEKPPVRKDKFTGGGSSDFQNKATKQTVNLRSFGKLLIFHTETLKNTFS